MTKALRRGVQQSSPAFCRCSSSCSSPPAPARPCPGGPRRHRPGRHADRAGQGRNPRGLPGLVHGRRAKTPAPACPGQCWPVSIGEIESDHWFSCSTLPGIRLRRQQRWRRRPHAEFEPATFSQFAVNADPGQPLSPYRPGRRDLHRRRHAVRQRRPRRCRHGHRERGLRLQPRRLVRQRGHVLGLQVRRPGRQQRRRHGDHVRRCSSFGKPYQWGAAGPDAYDCSGLVYAAYAAAGIHIARTTYQWQQDGPVIPLSQIQPGDLLFSAGSDGTASDPGHVVMYLGNGQVIQAPQTGQDVQVDPVDLASVVVATRPADLASQP